MLQWAGAGTFAAGLRQLGQPFEVVGAFECDEEGELLIWQPLRRRTALSSFLKRWPERGRITHER